MGKYSLVIMLIVLFSCKQKEVNVIPPANSSDTITTEKDSVGIKSSNQQSGDTIAMLVEDEKDGFTAIGTVDSIHPRIYVKFSNNITGNLKASIQPQDGDGNIRFNQLIFPDKTMDGPFGKQLQYKLKSTGAHILVIGHSLMAEDQYFGKFKIKIQVTED